jgi:hypothetical protein
MNKRLKGKKHVRWGRGFWKNRAYPTPRKTFTRDVVGFFYFRRHISKLRLELAGYPEWVKCTVESAVEFADALLEELEATDSKELDK